MLDQHQPEGKYVYIGSSMLNNVDRRFDRLQIL